MSYKCSNCANHEGCFDADVNDMGCEHFRVDQQSDKKLQLVIECHLLYEQQRSPLY